MSSENTPTKLQVSSTSDASPVEKHYFIPSPMVTRRTRTFSATRFAVEGPICTGVCISFSKARGHGFIKRDNEEAALFVHVSDVDSDYVPLAGDKVIFKLAPTPPKNEKFQAVQVQLVDIDISKHHLWSEE